MYKIRAHILQFFILIPLLVGCAATEKGHYAGKSTAPIELLDGEIALDISHVDTKDISLPEEHIMQEGRIFLFTPFEVVSNKSRFTLDAIEPPRGRYAAVRDVGNGLFINNGSAKLYRVSYKVKYATKKAAKKAFVSIPDSAITKIEIDGNKQFLVDNWSFNVALIPSENGLAFRVAVYDLEYFLPENKQDDETVSSELTVPVIITVIYRYLDDTTNEFKQVNILFEYVISTNNGAYKSQPQLSNWIQLPKDDKQPFSIEIVVAEILIDEEEFYEVFFNWVKKIRSLI